MSIRRRIIIYLMAFLLTSLLLGMGAFRLFNTVGHMLESIYGDVRKDIVFDDIEQEIRTIHSSMTKWKATADPAAIAQARQSASKLDELRVSLLSLYNNSEFILPLDAGLRAFIEETQGVESTDAPDINALAEAHAYLDESLASIHQQIRGSSLSSIDKGLFYKRKLTLYLLALIVFCLVSSAALIVILKRIIESPYDDLLKATGEVAKGNLAYRIGSASEDEFGTIARGFDGMVEQLDINERELNRRLKETGLLLSLARMPWVVSDRQGAIQYITETVAEALEKDFCAIFSLSADGKRFEETACSLELDSTKFLDMNIDIISKVASTLKPVVVDNLEDYPVLVSICSKAKSIVIAPLAQQQHCDGLVLIGGQKTDPSEVEMLQVIAMSILNAISNIRLYNETQRHINRIEILYGLSKAITSYYDPVDLLKSIAQQVAGHINAKTCVIRLIEGQKLVVYSYYGRVEGGALTARIDIGQGIEGKVALEGGHMLVENISRLPENLKEHTLPGINALVVSLKKDANIIGTIGLYDKVDPTGRVVPFTFDDAEVAEGVASITAIAIEKARMQEYEKLVEHERLKTERRMQLLFESVQSGIVTLDRNFIIKSANKYLERWIDQPHESILFKSALEVFHEKGGICPHCAARPTFEEGGVYTITQSSGLNYADLSSYPVKDENGVITESIVFIQDITDRVLYQEEIMGLYREMMQTKEYLESLISNSADAIVTTSLDGIVNSWNPAAQKIYGYSKDEVEGKPMLIIPPSLAESELQNTEKLKKGEVLNIETLRLHKDGSELLVSVTLSPIKSVSGEIIGISGISRDITEKKRVEKELIRRNQELSRLFIISSTMRSTLRLDLLIQMILTAVTFSDGLGFNRAMLFLYDEEKRSLRGKMGVGPTSAEDAGTIWRELSESKISLGDIMRKIEATETYKPSALDLVCREMEVSIDDDTPMARAAKEKAPISVRADNGSAIRDSLIAARLGTNAYAVVPLVTRDKLIGVLWVDNLYNGQVITDEDIRFITGFVDQMSSAIEAARLFEKVSLAEEELERIFSSITDMVFLTQKDYTIRNVNQAVVDRIGLPREQIIGQKCFKIFHNMDEPWPRCPHHKTVQSMAPFVEEVDDPFLQGTFITSTAPMMDKGQFVGTVHVVRDISELNELRQRLQSAERKAALGEVAAKVAHEIRNPLVSVGGFAKRLEQNLDGAHQEYARIIAAEVSRLEEILKDILGFVREVRMNMREVDFNDVVRSVNALIAPEIEKKGNTARLELYPKAIVMNIDPDRVREAVMNIFKNANEATENGLIIVRTYIENGQGVLEIDDTGIGVADAYKDKLFDPFFTTRTTGTGLGLAVSKRIVEENFGVIEIEQKKPLQGTIFRIRLPFQKEEKNENTGS